MDAEQIRGRLRALFFGISPNMLGKPAEVGGTAIRIKHLTINDWCGIKKVDSLFSRIS